MDKDHSFESYDDQIKVQLVDGDHERMSELLLRNQHIDQVPERQLAWCLLTHFAVMIDPILYISLRLLERTWILQIKHLLLLRWYLLLMLRMLLDDLDIVHVIERYLSWV